MPFTERLPGTLQENLLTLLVHSDEHGRIVANLVDPTLFEGDYRIIAERATDYWARYNCAPGAHMADLLSDILEARHDRRAGTYRNILAEMLKLSESINAKYSIDRARDFVLCQKYQLAIRDSASKLGSQREIAVPEVREMLSDLVRLRNDTLERGVSLNDTDKLLEYLRNVSAEFETGIKELDRLNIGPMRDTVMMIVAPTGVGKSWALIHLAKRALMQRKKVLYISLEMSEGELLLRFYQSFFGIVDRTLREPIMAPVLELDERGKLIAIDREELEPEFAMDSPNLEDELETRRALMEGKFKNIEIKRYPTGKLTINELRGYMDALEVAGFIPDVVVLDYIGIMNIDDRREPRFSLSKTLADFRGLCVERHIAGITAQQINRAGSKAERATQYDIAEAWALASHADITLSISATEDEARFGFARLFVEKSRRTRGRFGVLLTQNYGTGQFVLDSVPFDEKRYKDLRPQGIADDDADASGTDDE